MSYTKKTWNQTMDDLAETFARWGVLRWETTPQRAPRKLYQSEAERAVTVTWYVLGQQVQLSLNRFSTAQENLRALYISIEETRKIEGRGVGDLMRQIYKQLPAPGEIQLTAQAQQDALAPYHVLGLVPGASLDVAEAAYLLLMRSAHPDMPSGSHEQAIRLTAAIDAIRKEQAA